jgi:hypothetical protein
MNWKGYRRKLPWPNLRHYQVIFLEGLRNPTKNNTIFLDITPRRHIPEDGTLHKPRRYNVKSYSLRTSGYRRLGRHSNSAPSVYMLETLSLEPACSVLLLKLKVPYLLPS